MTLVKKIEIRNLKENLKSKCKGMFKSNCKVHFNAEIEGHSKQRTVMNLKKNFWKEIQTSSVKINIKIEM